MGIHEGQQVLKFGAKNVWRFCER